MKKEIHIIESSICKLAAMFIVPVITMGTILMGTPLSAFINIPSLLIVVGLLGGGILFSFGVIVPIKSIYCALWVNKPLNKTDLELSIQLFDYAASISIGAGIVGSMVAFIQIFMVSKNWQVLDTRTAIALLPIFYGCVLSYFVMKPLKYSLINNQLKRTVR
ncbi:MAG: hypothetical protein MI892_05370 [Desulfobacterales bacterium]|nr:hypothetical protein [Desulfobacterales bacterium]